MHGMPMLRKAKTLFYSIPWDLGNLSISLFMGNRVSQGPSEDVPTPNKVYEISLIHDNIMDVMKLQKNNLGQLACISSPQFSWQSI
jgi:hypothetical protein